MLGQRKIQRYILLVCIREIIPYIEEKHADIYDISCFKGVSVNQKNGGGPHRDAVYLMEILEEFR